MRVPGAWLAILVTLLTWPAPAAAQQRRQFDPAHVYRVSADGAPALGPADAPVTIVEFSDFYCRYCARSRQTLAQLWTLYPGKIRLVFRHDPLDPDDGTLAAEAAMAADAQGRFWDMHERLYAEPAVTREQVDAHARALGLDMVRFRRDLDGHRHRDVILRDARDAAELGVASTPMFFINGRPIKGAQPLSAFRAVIDQELARAARLASTGVAGRDLYQTAVARGRPRGELGEIDEYAAAASPPAGTHYRVHIDPARVRGAADALVTLVVFADFECPACRAAAPVIEEIRRRFGRDLRVVFRQFPLDMHRHAELAAEAFAAAAAQGKGWEMHDAMFGHDGPLDRGALRELAADVGLDLAAFDTALDRRRYRAAVLAESASAAAIGVRATPTLLINGELLEGMPPADYLADLIEAARTRAAARVAAGVSRSTVLDDLLAGAEVVEP